MSAAAQSPTPTKPHKISPRQDVVLSPRENRGKSSRESIDYTMPVSGNTSLVSDKGGESERRVDMDRGVGSSTHEVEESLIEVLDDSPGEGTTGAKRPRLSETSPVRTGSETSDIPEELHSSDKEESIVEIIDEAHIPSPRGEKVVFPDMSRSVRPENERNDQLSITPSKEILSKPLARKPLAKHQIKSTLEPGSSLVLAKDSTEEISEHSRSTVSIPEQVLSVDEDEASKSSEIPEELSERSYTPIPSDASVSEEDGRVVKDTHSKATSSPQQSPKSAKDITSKTASYSYGDDTFENTYTEPKSSTSIAKKSPSESKTNISQDIPNEKISLEKSQSISEHLTDPAKESPSASEHLTGPAKEGGSIYDEPSYTEPESDTSVSDRSSVNLRKEEKSKSEANKSPTSDRRKSSHASDISKSLLSDDEISQKSITSSSRSRATTEDEKSESDRQATKPSSVVPEQRAATRSDEEKSSVSEHRKSPEQVEAQSKASPRIGDSAPDRTESLSEASSIAEEIAEGYEDEDISEGGGVLKESDELIFGDNMKDERMEVDESGLDRLDGTGLDEPGSKEHRLDITELDETGLDIPGFNESKESELDESGLHKPELNKTALVKPVLDKLGLKEPDESKIKQSGNYTDIDISRETAADISPAKQTINENDDSSKSSRSQTSRGVGTNEQLKESEDEQYSDDFDNASIPEEISEIGEEFSENTEDSDKGENFAMFVSVDKAMEGGEEITLRTGDVSPDHESESRAKHVVDDITNALYKDVIADSLTSMKNLKTGKLQVAANITDDKNDVQEQNRTSLTKAFSTVTRKLVDNEGPLDTREVISEHEDTQGRGNKDVPTATDKITDEQPDTSATVGVTRGRMDTDRLKSSQAATERNKKGHLNTDSITKDLLADAIMQMIEIKQRKKEKNIKLTVAVETKPSETRSSRTELSPPTGKTLPENIPDATIPTGTTSPVNIPEIESPADDETAIDNALKIAKTNQFVDDDALRSIDDDIAGLLGTPVDDEDEFPVNITNFGSDIPSDNEASLPEYSPMLAVPHSTQELTPMVNLTVDVLLEQRRLGRPLEDCIPQAQFLAGDTENELECVSIQSYRHLVFDLTKEVFIDTISENEPAARPPWAKAKWKGGQKLSRHFKRWKSDEEIRAAVLKRVTNVIGLGAPRATMATIPRKTPVRGNKKDNVDAILIEELRQEEPLWTDYEEDETNVKFQVADAILNMMLEDTARVFNAIQAKKHVPDDVIIV